MFRGFPKNILRKKVEVTGEWRKMYKEELPAFLLTTNYFEIKYDRNGGTCSMRGRKKQL